MHVFYSYISTNLIFYLIPDLDHHEQSSYNDKKR